MERLLGRAPHGQSHAGGRRARAALRRPHGAGGQGRRGGPPGASADRASRRRRCRRSGGRRVRPVSPLGRAQQQRLFSRRGRRKSDARAVVVAVGDQARPRLGGGGGSISARDPLLQRYEEGNEAASGASAALQPPRVPLVDRRPHAGGAPAAPQPPRVPLVDRRPHAGGGGKGGEGGGRVLHRHHGGPGEDALHRRRRGGDARRAIDRRAGRGRPRPVAGEEARHRQASRHVERVERVAGGGQAVAGVGLPAAGGQQPEWVVRLICLLGSGVGSGTAATGGRSQVPQPSGAPPLTYIRMGLVKTSVPRPGRDDLLGCAGHRDVHHGKSYS